MIMIPSTDLSCFQGFEVRHACHPKKKRKCCSLARKLKYNITKKTTTLKRQYNFIILIKGIFKLPPEATSCKEIHDKDM